MSVKWKFILGNLFGNLLSNLVESEITNGQFSDSWRSSFCASCRLLQYRRVRARVLSNRSTAVAEDIEPGENKRARQRIDTNKHLRAWNGTRCLCLLCLNFENEPVEVTQMPIFVYFFYECEPVHIHSESLLLNLQTHFCLALPACCLAKRTFRICNFCSLPA